MPRIQLLFSILVFYVFSVAQSDSILTISGYAFPDGIPEDNSGAMISALQSTLQSHFDMVPPSLRSQNYVGAKQALDAAVAGASSYSSGLRAGVDMVPNLAAMRAPDGGLLSSMTGNLPSPVKRLLDAVQYFRSMCPLCQLIDKAIGGGNMPMSIYAIDANGKIFIDRGNELIPSGYSFNGKAIVDSAGATIASLTS